MTHFAETLSALVAIVTVWLSIELFQHLRALRKVPIRVHVNGTRGKSSVTRLIASGLRAGGRRVVAKTTGTLARVILPNERELAVYRPQGANVREQIRIVRFAAVHRADILVVECMALQPILQWLSERAFVRATHGVITNARPDHLDVMGPRGEDVAKALCGMMPRSAVCFTAERDHLATLQMAAADRKSRLVQLHDDSENETNEGADESGSDERVAAVTEEELDAFRWFEHRENIDLALRVCTSLGVARQTALQGMQQGQPDPGALTFDEIDFFGRHITFVNAFAANDPISSHQIWELCADRRPNARKICVFNCRVDRADRSRQLGQSLPSWSPADHVVTVGSGTVFFSRAAASSGYDVSHLVNVEGYDARATFERLIELCGERTLIVGLGNIGGLGLDLTRIFRNRSTRFLRAMEPA